MWGISYPNLQMMMVDSVAVLLHTEGNNGGSAGQGVPAASSSQTPGTHTTPPMNFGQFLKKMHEIQDHHKRQ